MSINITHRKRLARALAAQTGQPYQQALDTRDCRRERWGPTPRAQRRRPGRRAAHPDLTALDGTVRDRFGRGP